MKNGRIQSEQGSYRRGVVLGLTMAEIMLLLIFCLLISAAALMSRDKEQIAQLLTERDEATTKLREQKDLASLVERLEKAQKDHKITDDWQELVRSQSAVKDIEAAGLSVKDLVKSAPLLKELIATKDQISTKDPAGDLRFSKQLQEQIAAAGLEMPTPEKIVEALARQPDGDGRGHEWPPMISLSEAGGSFFALGSAKIPPDFEQRLRNDVVPKLVEILKQYPVDVVEVIGHTDEQVIAPRNSNLDEALVPVLRGQREVTELTPADNAGLGLARAASVVNFLAADGRLKKPKIIPLSAAQLVQPGDQLTKGSSGDAPQRRRIEIRVRPSNKDTQPSNQNLKAEALQIAALPRETLTGSIPLPVPPPADIQQAPVSEKTLTGRASVIDGDTIEIAGTRIRLHGIDAPESGQVCRNAGQGSYVCGRASAMSLQVYLAAASPTRCELSGEETFGRKIATCYRASGEDVAAWMVESGNALDFPKYSKGVYAAQQRAAQKAKSGVWAGSFIAPWEWRETQRRAAQ